MPGRPRLHGLGTDTRAFFSLFFPSFCFKRLEIDCLVALLGVLRFHFSSLSFPKFILGLPPQLQAFRATHHSPGRVRAQATRAAGDLPCSAAMPLGNSLPSHSAVTFPSSLWQLLCRLASLCSPAPVTPLQGLRAPMGHARGQLAGRPLSPSSFRRVVRTAKTLGPTALSKPHSEPDPALLAPACSSPAWR